MLGEQLAWSSAWTLALQLVEPLVSLTVPL
jgi:hypothetical protein